MNGRSPGNTYAGTKAQAYDRRIRDAIPGYEALHQLACLAATGAIGGHGRVLVVGAGSGTECVALAQAGPDIRVAGIDPAQDMVAVARAKVAGLGLTDRIDLRCGFLSDAAGEDATYDAATLLLVLHFLPDDGAKAALLGEVARHLKPGARLVLADLFGPGWDDPWQGRLRQMWRQSQVSAGIAPEAVDKGFAHVDRDIHPVTEARLGELLVGAGFGVPRPFFRALCFGGWVAERR